MVRSSGVRIARHHAACRTVDTKPRRGILADDPVSDRSGRRRCLQPLQKGGNAVFFGCGEAVHPDGAVGYRRSGIVGSVPYPEPALACSEKRNVFVKPSAEPNLFRLCRGEKTKNEIQPELPIAYEVERSRKKETERCANTAPSGRLTPATYLSKY